MSVCWSVSLCLCPSHGHLALVAPTDCLEAATALTHWSPTVYTVVKCLRSFVKANITMCQVVQGQDPTMLCGMVVGHAVSVAYSVSG